MCWYVSYCQVTGDGLTHHQARGNEWPPLIVMTVWSRTMTVRLRTMTVWSRTMTVRSRTAALPATCEVAPLSKPELCHAVWPLELSHCNNGMGYSKISYNLQT